MLNNKAIKEMYKSIKNIKNKIINYIIKNEEKIFVIGITLLYAIITAILAFHHENWRDENQVWLLCKNLSFLDLMKQLKYEGHPFLWFSIIYPFVRLGASVKILNIISWIIMVCSTYIVLKRAPLNKLGKIAIILTFPMMYQYVIVARSYSLIVLLTVLICAFEKHKKEYPILYAVLLGLLANTHIIMIGLVGCITITFYIFELLFNRKNNTKEQNKKLFIGLIIIVFFAILIVIQLSGASNSIDQKELMDIKSISKIIIEKVRELPSGIINSNTSDLQYIVTYALLIFVGVGIVDYKKELLIFIFSTIWAMLIIHISASENLYLQMSVYFILLYCIWSVAERIKTYSDKNKNSDINNEKLKELMKKKNKATINSLAIVLVLISMASISIINSWYEQDYKTNYSSAKEMAEFINNNLNDDAIIVTYADAECSTMIPYIKMKRMWNINTQDYFSYITWNEERKQLVDEEEIKAIIKKNFRNSDIIYYLCSPATDDYVRDYLKKEGIIGKRLFGTNPSIVEESYEIFKVDI